MNHLASFHAPTSKLRYRYAMSHHVTPSTDTRDEIASALTHGLGAIAALAGGTVLVCQAAINGDRWQLSTALVFSVTLLLLYISSTLYHAIPSPQIKARLQVVDHCAIYLLIAGTYTPFTLIGLRGPWGWSLFAAIWILAVCGVVYKFFFTGRFRLLSTCLYVAMGWLVLIAIKPLIHSLDASALAWLLAGGLCYTAGTYFYQRDAIRYFHAIWHLFVLGGSACHFVAVSSQVL